MKALLRMVLLTMTAAAAALAALSCGSGYSGEASALTVAAPALEQNALLYVAESRGLFTRNGLQVSIRDYDSGVGAVNDMLNGSADIAEAAEFLLAGAVLRGAPISLIAVNDQFQNDYVVAPKDRGIKVVSDLKGKRIGVARQTIAEFYLGRFLELNGLGFQDVTLVDVRPAHFVDAVVSGEVDAVTVWQPYASQILEKTGGGAALWSAHSSQPAFGVLACREEWLAGHTAEVGRLLKSLTEAESYLIKHPAEARAIVGNRLNYDSSYVTGIWPDHRFALSLDHSLVTAMEDEARWMMKNNLTAEKVVPDFKKYVYIEGLKAVKPDAVNIIR